MKKFLSIHIFVLSATVLFFTGLSAQFSDEEIFWKNIPKSADPVLLADAKLDSPTLADMKAVNEKAYGRFIKMFPAATDVRFTENKSGLFVTFKENGKTNRALYNKKGRMEYVTKNYPATALADEMIDFVESAYPGYLVFGYVTEVTVADKSATLIMIENRKTWKRVRIINGEIDVYEEFKKI